VSNVEVNEARNEDLKIRGISTKFQGPSVNADKKFQWREAALPLQTTFLNNIKYIHNLQLSSLTYCHKAKRGFKLPPGNVSHAA
jgi:hypothetical protein